MADDIQDVVKAKYRQAALRAAAGGAGCCGEGSASAITEGLYSSGETTGLPAEALTASLGCGNPTALAELRAGEIVLDLGSGGGIDVLLSARRVGPGGKAYGLDMTDEMLALARENQRKASVENVEFLKGAIERIPLAEASVDVVVSNCVINLSTDKDQALAEAFRVLRPGGRLAVSDIVVRGALPAEIRRSLELWAGCVAGALSEAEYRATLARAGFVDIDVTVTRVYRAEEIKDWLAAAGLADRAAEVEGALTSAFVRARKPEDPSMSVAPRVHVHLSVSSLEKSRAFYERLFGVPPAKVRPGYVKFLPPFGPLNLALSEGSAPEGRGRVDHMGIQVGTREVVARELARVRAAGLDVREEMGVDCCHANQDKFWVEDPDGVEWEVYVLNYDLEDEAPAPRARPGGLEVLPGPSCCAPSGD